MFLVSLVPAVVFYHVSHFDNKLSFFVFLAVFEGMLLEMESKIKD